MLSWKITTCVTAIVHSFFCLVEHPTIYHSLGRLGCREGDRHPQQEGAQNDIGNYSEKRPHCPGGRMDHAGDARGDDRHPDQHGRQVEIGSDRFDMVGLGLGWDIWYFEVVRQDWQKHVSNIVAICLNLRLQVPLLLQLVARRCETVRHHRHQVL